MDMGFCSLSKQMRIRSLRRILSERPSFSAAGWVGRSHSGLVPYEEETPSCFVKKHLEIHCLLKIFEIWRQRFDHLFQCSRLFVHLSFLKYSETTIQDSCWWLLNLEMLG